MSSQETNAYWAEAFKWERTVDSHIWRRNDGKYHFSDEASQFDETPYDSLEECKAALGHYVATYL